MSPFIAAALSAAAGMLVVVSSATAGPASDGTSPNARDPLDPKASVPQTVYRSAFTGYRPGAEEKVGSWKELNDTVGRIGGWRVYAKEARAPEAGAAPPGPAASGATAPAGPASASPSTPAGHGGHKTN